MHELLIVLIFLLAIVVSGVISRLLPIKMPLPLLQIVLGACMSYVFQFDVALDPHLFFLLFIPPLLFLDGWRIPKGAFFHDWKPILMLAIGLVVFTVVSIGFFINWVIPAIPLAVAFALAAILSPTDPVAVSAMTAGSPLPSRLMHILEGESLLNGLLQLCRRGSHDRHVFPHRGFQKLPYGCGRRGFGWTDYHRSRRHAEPHTGASYG
jgi:NhaP-type Na+/H+ or K+/H+ antiporter